MKTQLQTWIAIFWFLIGIAKAESHPKCQSLEAQPIKLEAWLSKRYRADFGYLRREFAAMGDTEVIIWEYPAENPSGAVAIGSCVPAFIGRYALQKALAYTKGVKSLVHQGFVHSHWMGIGTSLFSDWAQQPITRTQLNLLLSASLSTKEFHALYREFTTQDKTIFGFGMQIPNPKLMKD